MTREKVVLGEEDSCIVLRKGGGVELYLPKQEDDQEVYDTSRTAVLVTVFLDNEKLVEKATNLLEHKITRLYLATVASSKT